MREEKGVILAVHRESINSVRFLVLKRVKNWEGWELPKGHLEQDDYEHTVRLELGEEAGIPEEQIQDIRDMEYTAEWTYEDDGEEVHREYKAFLVKVDKDAHIDTSKNPSEEHEDGFFLRYSVVKDMLEYDNNVEVLNKAQKIIDDK